MKESRASYRYALALLAVSEEAGQLEEVFRNLQFLEKLMKESREFYQFLKSPVISAQRKKTIASGILEGHVSAITLKFVILLVAKNREGILQDIVIQFYRLRDERLGILNVTTRSAIAFSDAQGQDLSRQLEHVTKKKVRITYILDPSLKGGFTVQHDDTVWDASVRHQLKVLRQRFVEGKA